MQELTYEIPFERLRKLGRTMGRRAFRGVWMLRWGLLLGYLACLLILGSYADQLEGALEARGIYGGYLIVLIAITGIFLFAMIRLRKVQTRAIKARANFGLSIRLTKNEDGVHIETDEIAYFLKWRGINQMLLEPDGVVLSHGNLFFLVPDNAFASEADRNAFIRDVYAHLGETAKAKSEQEVRAVFTGTL
ncbi:MAG TPA: hypothetical protein VKA94_13145 [Hyphomicrobiales bacterium]|nr:hypothetical protein [Hyphomicrobiales bacterium]